MAPGSELVALDLVLNSMDRALYTNALLKIIQLVEIFQPIHFYVKNRR